MKTLLLTAVLFALAPLAFAGKSTGADPFKIIHTADLAPLVSQGTPGVYVFDANGNETREKEGVIPGAVTLASHDKYDLKVLPEDKSSKLVFYCANEQCMASHAAAKRASTAGYTDVSVLSDGIMGWKKNGQKAAPFKKKKA
jgi:rhodanese-related sulfurtransferase